MKKIIFFLVFSLLIIIPNSVRALEFTTPNNNYTYEVDSEEKLLAYCYYRFVYPQMNSENYEFYLVKSSYNNNYLFYYFPKYNVIIYKNSSYKSYSYLGGSVVTGSCATFSSSFEFLNYEPSVSMDTSQLYFYSKDIYNNDGSIKHNSNTSRSSIEEVYDTSLPQVYTITYYLNNEVYKTFEIEEGSSHTLIDYEYNKNTHIFSGWEYDANINLENITSDISISATLEEKDVQPVYIDFPIDKNEFYTLLVMLGTLIIMLFLKWCFPFKGGSDLKWL